MRVIETEYDAQWFLRELDIRIDERVFRRMVQGLTPGTTRYRLYARYKLAAKNTVARIEQFLNDGALDFEIDEVTTKLVTEK